MAGDSSISFIIYSCPLICRFSPALSFVTFSGSVISSGARNPFIYRGKMSGIAIHGKSDIPSMCVMEVVLTQKTAGRKNLKAPSSRGFCTMRVSVCRPSQEWVTGDWHSTFGHRFFDWRSSRYHFSSTVTTFRTAKKHPGNAFCLCSNAGGTRNRRRCGYMYQSTNVLAVVGARPRRGQGSVESMDFPDIFLFVLHVQP